MIVQLKLAQPKHEDAENMEPESSSREALRTVIAAPKLRSGCVSIKFHLSTADKHSRDPHLDLVTINVYNVANEKATFHVHKSFICYHSPFFSAAFTGNFVEGETQTMDYKHTSSEAFGLFVHWLYTQKMDDTFLRDFYKAFLADAISPAEHDKKFHERHHSSNATVCGHIADLWILAEKILAPKLQNLAMDALEELRFHCIDRLPATRCEYIYQHTRKGSPLRRFMVDWVMRKLAMTPEADAEKFPLEMHVELFNACRINGLRSVGAGGDERRMMEGLKAYLVDEEVLEKD